MKKTLTFLLILTFLSTIVFAQAVNEEKDEAVRLGVMQGPTGFSSSMLGDIAEISVYPSPNEAVARLVKGELDMVALPANAVSTLYNKGVAIKAVAIIGEGMLSIVGTNSSSNVLYVPGSGGTPDHMAQLLYSQYEANYSVTAPAQLAQLVIAGKAELAILPQPFVSMVLRQNQQVQIIDNVQEKWEALTGQKQYPMSILVVRSEYAQNNPSKVYKMKDAYKESIETILENPSVAGEKIEELGIMKAAMATPAIADCALVFKEGTEAKNEVTSYYEILLKLAPDAIGGKLPNEDFWL